MLLEAQLTNMFWLRKNMHMLEDLQFIKEEWRRLENARKEE
jgi:hypothetical protein